ncbi:MAG: transposase [Cyanothece sp. SIO2G6]|nr:transposase [Cyanothece sp. SIO2G6]
MIFDRLRSFRQEIYDSLGAARDALFDLMDAILTTPSLPSLVHLSLSPVFQRSWPSVYAALRDGRPPRNRLMRQYIEQIPTEVQPILVGDHSAWPRADAPTLQERSYVHTPTAIGSHPPVSLGHSYSTIAWIPEGSGSWALPLRHARISSFETPSQRASFQLKQVVRHLSVRPIAIYDREYGNANFAQHTKDVESDVLVRLAPNRCLYGAPPPYCGRGAPRKHGHKFKLNAPATWPQPTNSVVVDDPEAGPVLIQHWSAFHFRQAAHCPMEGLCIERLNPPKSRRSQRPLWLAWWGETMPTLEDSWPLYGRRFAIEHWYRFAKNRLHWTQPQTPDVKVTERWSDLMPLLTWQLWLAKAEAEDTPLPWQAPQDDPTPGRVAQGFGSIIARIGTPAPAPKPRGKSPGWPTGTPRTERRRYPTVKKRAKKKKPSVSSRNKEPAKVA